MGDDDNPCNATTLFFVHGATQTACRTSDSADDETSRGQRADYRTLWISDLHLGTPGCQARALLDFLKHTECETLFLVGDIIDGWQLRRQWYWPQSHNDVAQKLLRKARKGTSVIFIPGNHDEFARKYLNHNFGGIDVAEDWMHETADGRKLWVMHGDLFDGVIQCAKWLAHVGDSLYEFTLKLNRLPELASRSDGAALLVAVEVPQAESQACGELCRRLRAGRRARGAQARRAWRGLRTHPSCRTARDRRHSCTPTTATGLKA